MKKYSVLLLVLISSTLAFAQKPVINFPVKVHDFGKIHEENGRVTNVFEFTNNGNSPLVINRVRASCGCTTPSWSKEPIEPGQKGSITVTYNPNGRPGVFTKIITVYSNATEERSQLVIKGEVIPKIVSNDSQLPIVIGDLRLSTKVIQMNDIDKGDSRVRTIDIQNVGKQPISIALENLPSYVSADIIPETLNSNQTGKMVFSFDSKKCTEWGPVSDEAFLVLNGQKKFTEDFGLHIVANIIEDFSKMTLSQKRVAPILQTNGRTVEFGTVRTSAKKSVRYKIRNLGVNPLEIRRIINNNPEISIRENRTSIAGGKYGYLIVQLNTGKLPKGEYKKSMTIQTNDPDHPFIIVVLSWKVA